MKINYKINKQNHKITFCPDNQGLAIKKKTKSYMLLSKDLKKNYPGQKILIVFDKKIDKKIVKYMVHDLKISFPHIYTIVLNGSKVNKNEKTFFKLIDLLLKKDFTKKSILISCGGGVIGDICGLVSALYLRGLPHFHVPTTMTAIIDSCIGGKTAINYKRVINSIGTYYHSENVYISKNIVKLIPEREYLSGIPEIIKCGLIDNNITLKMLENKDKFLKRDYEFVFKIINNTLKTKIKFFKDDVYENNERLKLNFGHTFAHAIEMALEDGKSADVIRHGEAVGLGILCEIYYANRKNNVYRLVEKILKSYNLPVNLKNFVKKKFRVIFNKIYKNIFLDKKKLKKFPRYICLNKIGNSKVIEMKNFSLIRETLLKVLK